MNKKIYSLAMMALLAFGGATPLVAQETTDAAAEEAVAREVMEEVGLKVKNIRYYKSQPWGVAGNLSLGYFCEVDGDDTPNIDINELATATWHHRGEIPEGAKDDGISLTRELIRVFNE